MQEFHVKFVGREVVSIQSNDIDHSVGNYCLAVGKACSIVGRNPSTREDCIGNRRQSVDSSESEHGDSAAEK